LATLLLTARDTPAGCRTAGNEHTPLREWQRQDWTILFSHPDDFVRCEFEMDRWLALVQRAFAGCRIRPLALGPQADGGRQSWVAQASRDTRLVVLEEPGPAAATSPELRARALYRAIRTLRTRRFVMVIDSSLNPRRTFTYNGLADAPSPLELLGWADATRTRHSREEPAQEPASAQYAHPSAYRHHRHRPGAAACRSPAHRDGVRRASHA
jgi:hypothetical protein